MARPIRQRATDLKNVGKKVYCGGIDVGGTKISAALFTRDGRLTGRVRAPIDKGTAAKPVRQIAGIIRGLEEGAVRAGGGLRAVGICIPGIVFAESGKVWAPNIPGWDRYPLQDKLTAVTRTPVVLGCDRDAYVLGEQWRGAARGLRDVAFLAVGTGIGAGILSGGRLCRGSRDIAGAVGWFALDPRFKTEYAAMGCFEAEASGASIGRNAREFLRTGAPSSMKGLVRGRLENITAEAVIAAARSGDRLARFIIDSAVGYLAMGVANIVSLLNPEMIILGGGLFQAGDILLEPVRKEFKKWAQPIAARQVKLKLSALGENAGLYGAAKLAWEAADSWWASGTMIF
jgi:glucokinase